jgi:hypothetical protein
MTFAVFDTHTGRIAQDAEGNPHNYSTYEQAEQIAFQLDYAWLISKECQDGHSRYQVKRV